MKSLSFQIYLKPISANHAYGRLRNGRSFKNKQFKDFENTIIQEISLHQKEISQFLRQYDPKKHFFSCNYQFLIPIGEFFSKSGQIRKRRNDIDNFIKHYQDTLFKVLGVDDSSILDIYAQKLPSNGFHQIKTIIELGELIEISKQGTTKDLQRKELSSMSLKKPSIGTSHQNPWSRGR